MTQAIDRYLNTLLTFVPRSRANRFPKDYLALVHVPAVGPEKVYSLVYDKLKPLLTVAAYKTAVWEMVEDWEDAVERQPELDALQAEVDPEHPAFEFLDRSMLRSCQNYSDGKTGLDYYLMLWQKDGESGVVECYEPYSQEDGVWETVIGAMQTLASQFEYAAFQSDLE